jgi:ribonuclease HII
MNKAEKQQELLGKLIQAETECRKIGYQLIAGADEAGRGPLAGPVVAACVMLPEHALIPGVNDSKKLSEAKREELYEKITDSALAYGVGIVEQDVIDQINILCATRLAFKKAVESMQVTPDYLYTDMIDRLDVACPWTPVKKGDATVYCIAAASIVAKVTRDRIMRTYDAVYPAYGFARHKGYGTQMHINAIREHGLTPLHRRSFIKNIVVGPAE